MSQEKLNTVDIKGKPYVLVNERVKAFRKNYPNYGLITTIVELSEKRVVMCATINNPDGFPIATGYAYEDAGSSFINKTSYIENCETSAWGRALANLGIGIDGSMCSTEELGNALLNQSKPAKRTNESIAKQIDDMIDDEPLKTINIAAVNTLKAKLDEYNTVCGRNATEQEISKFYKCSNFNEFDYTNFKNCITMLDGSIKKVGADKK